MRLFAWLAVTGVAFSAAAAACTYPSFHFRGEDGGGGTGVGGMPNGGNGLGGTDTGVAGGGATPTGTGAGGTGAGGGTGPTGCDLWGTAVCGDGQKCTVVNESTGATDCGPAGDHPSWSRCTSDAECADRTWCDHEKGVCKPVCQDATLHCPDQGDCNTAMASGGGTIPGVLRICTAHCDPLNANSCNQSHGNTNCILDDPYGFDCFASGDGGWLYPCLESTECQPGLGCYITNVLPYCRFWCMVNNDLCSLGQCHGFAQPVYYNGEELGVCG